MKNTKLKLPILGCLILVSSFQVKVFAQDYIFRAGLKIGWPQVAGLNIEYVAPLLNKKLSVDLDVTYLPITLNGNIENLIGIRPYINRINSYLNNNNSNINGNLNYTNITIGFDYHFLNRIHGLYAGMGLNFMNIEVTGSETATKNISGFGTIDALITANAIKEINSFFIKIGGIHGKHYYFRWETGYTFTLINNPDNINFIGIIDGIPVQIPNSTINLPSYLITGLMANIGCGISF